MNRQQRRRRGLVRLLLTIAFVAVVGVCGYMERQDEIAEQKEYCDNVRDHLWPDFEGTYEEECTP